MEYKEWKATLTPAHEDKIAEAILMDEENSVCNPWLDDNECLINVVKHYGGTEEFAYRLLDEWEDEEL